MCHSPRLDANSLPTRAVADVFDRRSQPVAAETARGFKTAPSGKGEIR